MIEPVYSPLLALSRIDDLIRRGALFVVNHSGGKDSQAMMAILAGMVPADQILVVHAHLPEVEWPDTESHIRETVNGYETITTQAVKTFFEMLEHRGMFPAPRQRQCTSDLKRGPIDKVIRHATKRRGNGLVVNSMGMRAEESTDRAKRPVLTYSKRNSKAGREWYEWLPVHDLTTEQVFETIAAAGQKPHWAYAAGMSRLSCCFCIMASRQDLTTAARLRPALYRRYVETERRLGHSLLMPRKGEGPRFLEDVTSIRIDVNSPDDREDDAMTPDQLRAAGETLFGSRWQTALARALGRQPNEVRRWLYGTRPVPTTVVRFIRLLLFVHKSDRLDKALASIDSDDRG